MGPSAPLVGIPEAPIPAGGQAEWFTGAGGVRLRAALFPAQAEARGSVVLSPGRTEPIEKYFETIGDLTGRGFEVLVHDWRGQGLSQRLLPDRLRGHAVSFEDFLADHRALLDAFETRLRPPLIGLGHSMGGGLVLLALVKGEGRLAAAVLSAPMLAISTRPWPGAVASGAARLLGALGRAGDYALPAYDPVTNRFGSDLLTRDMGRYDRFKAQLRACPDLALGALTWGWLNFAFRSATALLAPGALEQVQTPVTIVAAGHERLVLNASSRAAARRLPHGRYIEIPDARHELLMETDDKRDAFWRAFDEAAAAVTPPQA